MAKTMSIIRYKYKADRDFESVQFEGLSCPLGELKRLIIEKSTRSGGHHSREDYDLIISDSTTHEEYKDPMDMIKRNTSVVVTRRMRGMFESLTPSTTRKPGISSDEIVNKYLRPVIGTSAVAEMKPVPLEAFNQPPSNNNNNSSEDFNEEERLKQVLKSSQPTYMPVAHRSNTSYICHNCKQPGHLRNQCPLLLQSSSSTNSTGHINGSSSVNNDGTQSTNSSLPKPTSYNSHIITNQAPYHYGHRTRHPRHTDLVKRPTGIPRNGLIRVPAPLPGVLTDKSGQAFVPKQMAELLIESSDKKAVVSSASVIQPVKSADEELPPDDLLCPICKKIYFDAVITPCCHNSFCDDCIRNALIESEIHECPQCHRQNVPINHINPNLILRKHVNQWQEERQQKSSLYYPLSQTNELNTDSMGTKLANNQNFNEPDEYDAAILPTVTQQQPVVPVKNAPIVIKMKPIGRSPSPSSQQSFETKSADIIASEDDKTSDNDIFNQKEKHINNSSNEESSSDKLTDSNVSENEKSDRHTPPSQVAPVSTILSSPPTTTTTTMASSSSSSVSVVPHYYPVHPHMPTHGQHIHPDMMYPTQHPLPTSYSMPPNYYPPVMHVSYPSGPSVLPMGGMTHYSSHSAYPPMHSHLNNYHIPHYESGNVPSLHHPNPSGSTLIPRGNQSMMKPTLTEDEFYSKQRSLQRTKRSTSRRRSRSSSRSSSTSSNSRTSSFSRRNDRYRRRLSRSPSRSRQRVERRRRDDHRPASPVRQQRRRSPPRHRSPADRNRTRTLPSSKDNHRRTSPVRAAAAPPPSSSQRSARDRERRRSPRPPPTALQSIQRTIVYSHDSSSSKTHSNRDNRRSRSRSRHRSRPKDDRTAPSSKIDHHSQSESRKSSSPITVPSNQRRVTLSSIITPVIEENSSKKTSTSIDTNNERKRKKTSSHQHSANKYRRYQSPHRNSRDRQNHRDDVADDDDDDDDANIVVENTTTDSRRVIEAQ